MICWVDGVAWHLKDISDAVSFYTFMSTDMKSLTDAGDATRNESDSDRMSLPPIKYAGITYHLGPSEEPPAIYSWTEVSEIRSSTTTSGMPEMCPHCCAYDVWLMVPSGSKYCDTCERVWK